MEKNPENPFSRSQIANQLQKLTKFILYGMASVNDNHEILESGSILNTIMLAYNDLLQE